MLGAVLGADAVCNDPSVCVRRTSSTINLPPALVVDRDEGRLLLHGVESGQAGISYMVIVESSGAMSGSVLGHGGGGFLIFGGCSATSSG